MWIRIALLLVSLACVSQADSLEQAVDTFLAAEPTPETGSLITAEPNKVSNPWDFELNLGFTTADGNTDATTFTGGFNLKNEWERWTIMFNLLSVYQESNGVETANRHGFVERYTRTLTKKGSLYQDLLLEHDSQEDLKYRITFTVGYRHELANVQKGDTQVFLLHGEVGAGILHEKYVAADETNPILDLGLTWTWNISKNLKYEQVIKAWPSFEDFGNYRIRWVSKFTTPIADRWNASLEINDKYNSRPPPGNEHNDILIALYLSYKFTEDKAE